MQTWTLLTLIALSLVAIGLDLTSVNGLERKLAKNEETKVKCKEVVDEALRQYWDHSREGLDSDEDDGDHSVKPSIESIEDNVECEEDTNESDGDDNSDGDNDDQTKEDSEEEQAVSVEQIDTKSSQTNEDDNDEEDKNDNSLDDDKRETSKRENDGKEKEKGTDHSDEEHEVEEDDHADSHKSDDRHDSADDGDDDDDHDKDEQESELSSEHKRRSRNHIDDILKVYEIGSQEDTSEQNLILSIFREMKKLYESSVKPLEMIYKYRHITTRLITDAEMLRKQSMVMLLGGKSTGKTSLINYLLGIDDTSMQLSTGPSTDYSHFTVLSYGDNYTRLSPTELSADFTFSSLQQFGQQFLENYIQAYRMPIKLLEKMTIIDSPGLVDQLSGAATTMGHPVIDNDVFQWFIDRSDVIYIVIDVTQLQLSTGLKHLIEQLKGRDVRFVLTKADLVPHQSQVIAIIGQLLWMLSPIMPSERPPQVFALTTVPQSVYDLFIDEQEVSWLKDLSDQISGINRVESRIAALRRHAIRVRNHAKLVDCYLATYYKNKGIFMFGASSRQLASDITENPHQYRVYSGALAGQSQNISRYDLPDPGVYREFFRSNPLIDFKPLTSTCSYFRGCPIDKLDITIAYQLPELVGKYKKLTRIQP